MKILHIAEFGSHANGIGTVVEHLYDEQQKLGHEVYILTTDENLAYKHLPLGYATGKRDFRRFIDKIKPDVVLFHSIWAMPYIGFAKVLNKKRVPYAVMMHGADSIENRRSAPFKKWLANILWFNEFLRRAKTVIFLSQGEYENCLSKDINKNHDIISNGCKPVAIDIDTQTIHKPVNIVYLGRMALHHKGIDVLLDALEILLNEGSKDVHVTFYGNENDRDILVIKQRLVNLKEIAHYAGPAYGEEKANVFKEADAFILTSRYEGMPMGVLEAISYGVPCILTPGTNMVEDIISSDAGWKTLLDANSVADTIKQAVNDMHKEYSLYHKAAYTMSKKYDWNIIAKEHVKVMEKIWNLDKKK